MIIDLSNIELHRNNNVGTVSMAYSLICRKRCSNGQHITPYNCVGHPVDTC